MPVSITPNREKQTTNVLKSWLDYSNQRMVVVHDCQTFLQMPTSTSSYLKLQQQHRG